MNKVCNVIDGVSHVSRIAALVDCDLELTRQAIAHLLFVETTSPFNLHPDPRLSHYQVIMMTEIFQYSNMYTLRRSIRWLADEPNVYEECGPYVTLPGGRSLFWTLSYRLTQFPLLGRQVPDWPKLLHLYSRMKSGKTVLEWMQEYQVEQYGIDVRRFTSFGVIKVVGNFVAITKVTQFPLGFPPSGPQVARSSTR